MPKGPKGERRPADAIGCAVMVAQIATGEVVDTHYITPARKKSGVSGGAARAESLTSERRAEIAKQAADVRWSEKRQEAIMSSSELNRLESLLFGGGRELLDIKFFPGEHACKPEELLAASATMLELALNGTGVFGAPKNKKPPSHFSELV